MEKKRFIIDVYHDIPDSVVVECISRVIKAGKISETKKGKQYCFVTTLRMFSGEPTNEVITNLAVTCNVLKSGTLKFQVYEDKK